MNKKAMTLNESLAAVETKLRRQQNTWKHYLPNNDDPEKTVALIMRMLKAQPDLMRACEHATFWRALAQLMTLDLTVDGAIGEAYLMMYGVEVKLVIGYKGLIKLAQRSGEVKSLFAACVYETDTFKVSYGMQQNVVHELDESSERTNGELTHVYAICTLTNGTQIPLVMDRASIENHRRSFSKGSERSSSPWVTSPERMWMKTVIRKMLNSGMIPLSAEIKDSLNEDDTINLPPTEKLINNFVESYEPDAEEVEA